MNEDRKKFGDYFKVKHGYAFKSEFFSDYGNYVVVTPGNFFDEGGFKKKGDKEKFYTGAVPDGFVLKRGDLIVAMTEQAEGLLGSSALIPENNYYLHNQRLGLITELDENKLDKKFLYYLFNLHDVRSQIRATATGAKIRHTAPERILGVRFRYLPIKVQRWVAAILSAYDDLIENNTQRIQILEEMARRIYEEWFVRFRFPGHENVTMVESELGLIPDGWKVQGLYDISELTYGFPFKSKLFNSNGGSIGIVRIRDIRTDRASAYTDEPFGQKYLLSDGDVLIGMDGEFHMGRWAGGKAALNQRVVMLRPKGDLSKYFLFLLIENPIKHLEATIVGTTVAHLSAQDLKSIKLITPTDDILKLIGPLFDSLFNQEIVLKKKNELLRRTRDLLLPKLISGEIDVSNFPEPVTD